MLIFTTLPLTAGLASLVGGPVTAFLSDAAKMMDMINPIMVDSVTISYFLIQILLGIGVLNQARKGFIKTAISSLIILTTYNYIFLNMFYLRK